MSWVKALADHITANNLGVQGTELFIGMMPDTDGLSILLSESGGGYGETFAAGIALHEPTLQIRVQGTPENYTTARERLADIVTLLQAITNQTIGGYLFLRVMPSTEILSIGQDERLRFQFSANFEVTYAGN